MYAWHPEIPERNLAGGVMGWGEGGALPEALSSSRFEVAALRTQEVTQELLQC